MVERGTIKSDKKELILAAALQLFVRFGFHDTPTSKIAKEAGVANGTLFYFYPTKDELIKALYLGIKCQMTENIAKQTKDKLSLHDIMKAYYTSTLQWALQHKTAFQFVEQFNSSPYRTIIADEEIEQHIKPLLELLRKGIKENIIKPLDVDLIFTLITAHTFSTNKYLLAKQYSKAKQDKVINDTFDLLWDMLT